MALSSDNDEPLIVTAHLDAASFALLDGLRRRYFPPVLNKIPAHVSLFHKLPGRETEKVVADVAAECARTAGFDLIPTGVRFLGRGVALDYTAAEIHWLHAGLARRWSAWLSAQDRQPFKPHVTIQNKVVPKVARELFETIGSERVPHCRVEGLEIWRYRGGPWEPVTTVQFTTGR